MQYGRGSRSKNLHRVRHVEESVRKSTKAQCVWDSGSANVLLVILLMLAQAGLECPGYTLRKYLPHRLKQIQIFFVSQVKRLCSLGKVD